MSVLEASRGGFTRRCSAPSVSCARMGELSLTDELAATQTQQTDKNRGQGRTLRIANWTTTSLPCGDEAAMSTAPIKPWVEVAALHPDVLAENFSEDIFALDLGPLADGNPNVPAVYRDPEHFFRASYLTKGLARAAARRAVAAGRRGRATAC